jgi:eukaryotic-like serine/threonine-protein kinase
VASRFDEGSTGDAAVVHTIHRGFELFGEPVDLVGRDAELGLLDAALKSSEKEDAPAVVALLGPEGIGKTRLLFELALRAEAREDTVYRLRALRLDGGLPSPLAQQILRVRFNLPPVLPTDEVRARLRDGLRDLVTARRLGDAVLLLGYLMGVPAEVEATRDQGLLAERAVASLVALVRRDASLTPHVLLADRFDETTPLDRALVSALTAAGEGPRLLLAVGARDHSCLSGELGEKAEKIVLGPLDKQSCRDLAFSMLSRFAAPPVELVRAMAQRSGGVPGTMEQGLRTLASRGIVDTSETPWRFRSEKLKRAQIPESVEESVRERLDSIEPRAKEILARAAVMGERFWLGGVLALMRVDLEEDEVYWVDERKSGRLNRTLLDLQALDIVQHEPDGMLDGEPEFRFQAPREAETLYGALNAEERRRRHRLVARWMDGQAEHAHDRSAWFLEIARHLKVGGRPSLAARALLKAAREASDRLRGEDALDHLREAMALLAEDEGADRYAARLLQGETARQLGRLDEAVEAFSAALLDSVIMDDKAAGARAYVSMGQALAARGMYTDAVEQVRRARVLFSELDDQQGIADCLDELGRALWARGDTDAYREALTHFLKALSLRRKLGDPARLAESLGNVARIHLGKGYALRARRHLEEAFAAHEQAGNRVGSVESLIGVGATWHEAGDHRRALQVWSRATATAEEIGDRHGLCILLNNMGEAYLSLDDFASARVYLREAIELAREVGEMRVVADAMRNEALGMSRRGDHERALKLVGDALDRAEQQNSAYHVATCRAARAHILCDAVEAGQEAETKEKHREISHDFSRAVGELERMGDDLALARVLLHYAAYLNGQGVKRGKALAERADGILSRLRSTEDEG